MTDPIFTRVSVREFRDLPVDDALITRLLKAAMQAPSAGDQRPWEFWVVTDPKTKEALSLASPYAEAAAKAPVVIVPCLVKPKLIYPENCQMDLSAATLSILLEAEQLDLGGTWMSLMPLEDRMDKVTEILSLPSTVVPFALVAIGYPLDDHPQEKRFDPSRVHYVK
ncbi:nitroreductase family protein [Sutterella sp. AF15-45LB]|jgi:nitroreductase|uniref:NADH oxidoreductase n=1 Tax=Mesosutterella multiformis TaxID=2259133 RepID=A0A388SE45_9BURK|nr:nitroreductase family protein [Mesosutterella multiformis]MBS5812281.1 nitroreductase family protein [Sutterella sp.]RGU76231.1 nitroreductase family protein [Sutterella sp. AF15-45LB]RGU77363.1 nitroreductase family protein [Sutterella sp. AF15-44LB]RHH08972.1 nitroreductase family protein [Sutterella sp. AM18-8-1]GBO94435.1 NADH oxidoreductase [Mesosutterella multiformis]